MKEILMQCPAKINLFLNIRGLNQKGYHELNLINQTVSLHDEICLSRGTGKLTINDPNIPNDETNSTIRAMKVFMNYIDENVNSFDIDIKKRIPTMAGLGGESTDAAAILIGLNILTEAYLSNEVLKKLAIQVGSDVPYFIEGGYKSVTGIGETINKIGINPYNNYLIIKPNINNSTRNMYAILDYVTNKQFEQKQYSGIMHNDFELIADPSIIAAKKLLLTSGAITVGMTGSGSAVVGVFEDQDNKTFEMIKSIYPTSFQATNSRGISIVKAS